MFRSILYFLMLLVVPSVHADHLFSVDVQNLMSAALAGAYKANPDLAPGDLITMQEDGSVLNLFCYSASLPASASKEDEFVPCIAHVQFRIASTIQTTVTRQGTRCTKKTESDEISVTVYSDGQVTAEVHRPGSPKGSSSRTSSCPETGQIK